MRLITFVFVFTLFLIVVLAVSTLTVVFLLAFLLLVVLNSYLVRSFADISSSFSQLLDFEHEFECINATDLPVLPLKRLQRATRQWTGELFYLSALLPLQTEDWRK